MVDKNDSPAAIGAGAYAKGPLEGAELSKSERQIEVGSSGLRRFGGQVQEEFEPQLRGAKAIKVFDEMRRVDPDVGAILTAIGMIIHSADWAVVPGGETPQDEEAAGFLESCMADMSHSWRDFIDEVLTMFAFGWAYFEIVYKQRVGRGADPASQYEDGRIGWRKVVLRGQDTLFRWEFDDTGGLQGMVQRVAFEMQERFIPIEKAVLFRPKREKNNPEGWSILRNAYRPYFIRKNLEEIEVIGAERDLTGTLVLYLPASASAADKARATTILETYKQDDQAGLLLWRMGPEPHEQWDAKLMASPGGGKIDMDKAIQRYAVAIARSVLAQFLTLGSGRVGSLALSKDHSNLFRLAVKGFLNVIQETINRFLVPKLFALNDFGQLTALPTIEHSDIGEVDLKTLGEFIAQISNAGIPVYDDDASAFLRSKAGLPPLPEGEAPKPKPEPGEEEGKKSAREWAEEYMAGAR